jgi:hypothetical protein
LVSKPACTPAIEVKKLAKHLFPSPSGEGGRRPDEVSR